MYKNELKAASQVGYTDLPGHILALVEQDFNEADNEEYNLSENEFALGDEEDQRLELLLTREQERDLQDFLTGFNQEQPELIVEDDASVEGSDIIYGEKENTHHKSNYFAPSGGIRNPRGKNIGRQIERANNKVIKDNLLRDNLIKLKERLIKILNKDPRYYNGLMSIIERIPQFSGFLFCQSIENITLTAKAIRDRYDLTCKEKNQIAFFKRNLIIDNKPIELAGPLLTDVASIMADQILLFDTDSKMLQQRAMSRGDYTDSNKVVKILNAIRAQRTNKVNIKTKDMVINAFNKVDITKKFKKKKVLNGANGEHTGSDDVETTHDELIALEYDYNNDKGIYTRKYAVVNQITIETTDGPVQNNYGICNNKYIRSYAKDADDQLVGVDVDGKVVYLVFANDFVKGNVDKGTYTETIKIVDGHGVIIGKSFKAKSAFEESYTSNLKGVIYRPLFDALKMKFPNFIGKEADLRIINAFVAIYVQDMGIPTDIILTTVNLYTIKRTENIPSLNKDLQNVNTKTIFKSDSKTIDVLSTVLIGSSRTFDGKVIIQDVYYPTRMNYTVNTERFTIESDHNVFDEDNFKFRNELKETTAYYVSLYFQLHGGSGNSYYSVHNKNLQSAASRLFKCRGGSIENENMYINNQVHYFKPILSLVKSMGSINSMLYGIKPILYLPKLGNNFILDPPKTNVLVGIFEYCLYNLNLDENLFKTYVANWLADPEKFRSEYANAPHIKKSERLKNLEKFLQNPYDMNYLFVIELKIKKEIAKFLKAPRLYVSYNEYGMFIPWFFELIKKKMSGLWCLDTGLKVDEIRGRAADTWSDYSIKRYNLTPDRKRGFVHVVLTPDYASVMGGFKNIVDVYNGCHGNCFIGVVFGDDAMVADHSNGIGSYWCTDISSCDSSCGKPLFEYFASLIQGVYGTPYSEAWLKQHHKPMDLKNPNDKTQKIRIKPKKDVYVLGSGSTVTTAMGTVANISIMDNIYKLWSKPLDIEMITSAAKNAGFVVTAPRISSLEQLQFLKRSPFISNGILCHALNRGVILRGFGAIENSFTHSQFPQMSVTAFNAALKNIEGEIKLANSFFSAIIAGYKNEPQCPIINALRTRFSTNELGAYVESKHFSKDDMSNIIIPDDFYYIRYGITPDELAELVDTIINLKLGSVIFNTAVSKILHVDYDYPLHYTSGNLTEEDEEQILNDLLNLVG